MYSVEHIKCRICGSDKTKFLGTRGNMEHAGAYDPSNLNEHMVTNVVKCKKCSFIYTNPLIISNTETYNDPSDYFSSSTVDPETLFKSTLALIEKHARKGNILDIGCGKGEFLNISKKRGWEAYGLEPSVNLAKFGLEKYSLNVVSTPLKDAGYPDRFFDVVVLNMVLEHVDDPKEFLSEIRRVLKKDGVLFIEVPNMDSLMLKMATIYFRLRGKEWSPLLSPLHHPFHCYGYNTSSLGYLLNSRGFDVRRKLVRDSGLRGFRHDSGGTGVEKFVRNALTRLAGLIGKGDVLMVLAKKKGGMN
ncbi:MAG: class I SAM-dependent methyltransferase [Candidatus Omnitrophica bacterium]|nr:class I SAM-dependent methyltransferase [Candidatus Omnitrophota bacterium]